MLYENNRKKEQQKYVESHLKEQMKIKNDIKITDCQEEKTGALQQIDLAHKILAEEEQVLRKKENEYK